MGLNVSNCTNPQNYCVQPQNTTQEQECICVIESQQNQQYDKQQSGKLIFEQYKTSYKNIQKNCQSQLHMCICNKYPWICKSSHHICSCNIDKELCKSVHIKSKQSFQQPCICNTIDNKNCKSLSHRCTCTDFQCFINNISCKIHSNYLQVTRQIQFNKDTIQEPEELQKQQSYDAIIKITLVLPYVLSKYDMRLILYDDEEIQQCMVCYQFNAILDICPNNHKEYICKDCLRFLLKMQQTKCPICRKQLPF